VESRAVPITVTGIQPTTAVTETFTGGLGRFALEQGNRLSGNDYGWTNTTRAGGAAAGELGGGFAATGSETAALIGDPLGGQLLLQHHDLVLKAQVYREGGIDGHVFIGFVNTASLDPNEGLGLDVRRDGSRVVAGGSAAPLAALPEAAAFTVDLRWNAATRRVTGTVGAEAIDLTVDSPRDVAYDAVVLGSFGQSGDRLVNAPLFADDFTYTAIAESTPPRLQAVRQGAKLALTWQGGGFQLQSRASLSTGEWADDPANVSSEGDVFRATIAASGTERYFRLAQ
jgi:hypothetical protein